MLIIPYLVGLVLVFGLAATLLALRDWWTGTVSARAVGERVRHGYDRYRVATIRRRNLPLARALIGHLASITEMNLPLATALRFAGGGRSGDEGRALRKMSNLLTLSAPLAEALRQSAPCPPSVGSLITAGERSGQLSQALRLAEDLLDEQIERAQTFSLRAYCAYPAAVLFSGFLIVGGIMYNVMPKFEDIFHDFDVQLPESTRILIGLSNWFILGFPPGWFWLACAVLIGAMILLIRTLWPGGRIIRFLKGVRDRVRWSLPFTRQIDWGQGMATACGVLEMGLTAGLPLDRAARLASDLRINHYVRIRLEEFTALVLGGASAVQAAREAKLGAMCVAALAAISRGENPHTVLGHAADCYRLVANRWWHAMARLLWPLGTLVLGAMVGFVVWALFEPLVALIESVMDGI